MSKYGRQVGLEYGGYGNGETYRVPICNVSIAFFLSKYLISSIF